MQKEPIEGRKIVTIQHLINLSTIIANMEGKDLTVQVETDTGNMPVKALCLSKEGVVLIRTEGEK